MTIDRLDHRIEQIEQELLRDDPALGRRFAKLDRAERRHDATVFTLLVSSAVFLTIGLATSSIVAWLVGVVSLVASASVDTRQERQLRAIRRSSESGHRRGRRPDQRGRGVSGGVRPSEGRPHEQRRHHHREAQRREGPVSTWPTSSPDAAEARTARVRGEPGGCVDGGRAAAVPWRRAGRAGCARRIESPTLRW